MSKILIRQLHQNELSLLQRLAENSEEQDKLTSLEKWIDPHNKLQGFVWAAFYENQIIAASCMVFASRRPWGSLLYLKVKAELSTAVRMETLAKLVDMSFAFAEQKGCIRVYMVNKLRRRGDFMNAKLFPLVKKLDRLKKYNFITESIVKAGEKPHYEYEWQLMGYRLSDEDIGIVSGTRQIYELSV